MANPKVATSAIKYTLESQADKNATHQSEKGFVLYLCRAAEVYVI